MLNERGQAAVTDALYFLTIVTALCIFMFAFSNSYGTSVSKQLSRQDSTDYATAALKTILYSSTPRDPLESLYDSDAEIDHLLAYIKEDYADNEKLSRETMRVLKDNIRAILKPREKAYDYVFYIHIPNDRKFVYVFYHFTNLKTTGCPGADPRFETYCADDPAHKNYFCGITDNAGELGDNSIDAGLLSGLIARVGDTAQSSAKIRLVKEIDGTSFEDFKAEARLVMWISTYTGTKQLYESPDWCCVEAEAGFSAPQNC